MCCSISDDGTTVIGTGKAVHARAFGSGGILYNLFIDTTENITGTHNNGNEIPEAYSLSQNYPNPFNPSTKIKFSIPKGITDKGLQPLVQIKVYDINGSEIETLVNKNMNPGSYEIDFDGRKYSSGVYFYKLVVSDASTSLSTSFSETRKMVLIK
jgi:hypothetical protein